MMSPGPPSDYEHRTTPPTMFNLQNWRTSSLASVLRDHFNECSDSTLKLHLVPQASLLEHLVNGCELKARPKKMVDVFLDTPTYDLLRAGCWLCFRTVLAETGERTTEWFFQRRYRDLDTGTHVYKEFRATSEPHLLKLVSAHLPPKALRSTLSETCRRRVTAYLTLRYHINSECCLDHTYFDLAGKESFYVITYALNRRNIRSLQRQIEEWWPSPTQAVYYLKYHNPLLYQTVTGKSAQEGFLQDEGGVETLNRWIGHQKPSEDDLRCIDEDQWEAHQNSIRNAQRVIELKRQYLPTLLQNEKNVGRWVVFWDDTPDKYEVVDTLTKANHLVDSQKGRRSFIVHITSISLASGADDGDALCCSISEDSSHNLRIFTTLWFEADNGDPVDFIVIVDTGNPLSFIVRSTTLATKKIPPFSRPKKFLGLGSTPGAADFVPMTIDDLPEADHFRFRSCRFDGTATYPVFSLCGTRDDRNVRFTTIIERLLILMLRSDLSNCFSSERAAVNLFNMTGPLLDPREKVVRVL
jgi:hypothetical protein